MISDWEHPVEEIGMMYRRSGNSRTVRAYYHKKRLHQIILILLDEFRAHCYFCHKRITGEDFPRRRTDRISIHHINNNHMDNRISNLALAHRTCHRFHHMEKQRRENQKKSHGKRLK